MGIYIYIYMYIYIYIYKIFYGSLPLPVANLDPRNVTQRVELLSELLVNMENEVRRKTWRYPGLFPDR